MSEAKPTSTSWFQRSGPGLITGVADDDPGGIATLSQVGAQFGFNLMWTVALTYPLMTAIQLSCARIGRVTGEGLAANMAHERNSGPLLARTSFVAEVRSLAHWLNQTVGRTYQFSCDADLGDTRCGVNLSSPLWSTTGTVATLSGSRGFTAAALGSFATDTFTLGVTIWTTGANAGRKAEIASFAGGAITLFEAPVRPIAVGDAFLATAGCDKQFATCSAKFGNGVNFRGFPHMPGEEAVLRYPNQGDANNGAPLV